MKKIIQTALHAGVQFLSVGKDSRLHVSHPLLNIQLNYTERQTM